MVVILSFFRNSLVASQGRFLQWSDRGSFRPADGRIFIRLRTRRVSRVLEARGPTWCVAEHSNRAFSSVPVAVKHGFKFHSAEPKSVMMTHWLPDDELCLLPEGASHTVGVGGLVYNEDKREILVVREKYSPFGGPSPYKLPGGYVKPGESLGLAAEREVEEETGIKAAFKGIITFRHMHPHLFSKSDLYFVALLTPLSFEPSRQEEEIAEVCWMPIEEYKKHPSVNAINQLIAHTFLESKGSGHFTLNLQPIEAGWLKSKTFHDVYTVDHPKNGE